MKLNRRDLLAGAGSFAATAALNKLGAQPPMAADLATMPGITAPGAEFPRKQDFVLAEGSVGLNNAGVHPMPIVTAAALRDFLEGRVTQRPAGARGNAGRGPDAKSLFAQLIGAKPTEISYVPNTSTGENMVVYGLGIDKMQGNVVTDSLHFDGALVHLGELQKRGLDLRIAREKDGRIDMNDLERAIDRNTKLVEVSAISMYNGFQHDLKAVCDLAHSHGAYVYADIIQAAGSVPIDVKAIGLDFAASSTYKWLMGDMGLGFMYAREDLLERVIKRSQIGYHAVARMAGRHPPFDPLGEQEPVSWALDNTRADKFFEVGSIGGLQARALGTSLQYLLDLGVANIQNYRTPLVRRLQDEVPRLTGLVLASPADPTSPIVTFAHKDRDKIRAISQKLSAARVTVRTSTYWVRFSPSIFTDMKDIERVLEVLS